MSTPEEAQDLSVDLLALPYETSWLGESDAPMNPLVHRLTTQVEGALTMVAEGDSTVATLSNGGTGHFRVALPSLDPARLGRFCFDYRGHAPGYVRIGLRRNRSSAREETRLSVPTPGDQVWSHACFDLATEMLDDQSLFDLSIHPPEAEDGEVALANVELTEQGPVAVTSLELDHRTRRCLALTGGSQVSWSLAVPAEATLSFGYAIRNSGWMGRGDGTYFRAVLTQGRQEHELWARYLNPFYDPAHRGWHEQAIDLTSFAGTSVTLTLQAWGSPPRAEPFRQTDDSRMDRPVLAAPRIDVASDQRPNVLVLLVDTLRADGVLHPERDTTPHLETLQAESVTFTRAFATAAWTHPSVGSLLSGLYPPDHGLGTASGGGLSSFAPGTVLLPEIFRAAGYATGAISNNPIVSAEMGFARGIDEFDGRPLQSHQVFGAQRVTEKALDWLARRPTGPFYLYLHYFDPHDRYQAPAPFTRNFVPSEGAIEPAARQGKPNELIFRMHTTEGERTDFTPDQFNVDYLRGLYDAEVQYLDHWVGELLSELRASGHLDNTMVVFTSDHGEEFMEHGYLKHGHALYNEQIHVPLWIRFPQSERAGTTVAHNVSLIDVLPTVLSTTNLTGPAGPGLDLLTSMTTDAWPERALFAVAYPGQSTHAPIVGKTKAAIVRGPWKLHAVVETEQFELFHLPEDPEERNDVAVDHPQILAQLLQEARQRLEGSEVDQTGTLSDEAREKLEALGYVR